MPPRIAIGQLTQETNHFVPFPTTYAHFERRSIRRGDTVLTGWGDTRTEVPGFLAVLAEAAAETVPTLCAWADAGGPVQRAAFERLLGELVERLRAAGPVDGVLLALHGAMVLDDTDDPEAEVIARVRAVVGPGVPIGVTLDLHGHVTPEMCQPGVFLLGYREYPHVDMYETGQRAARLMLETLAGRRRPVMATAKRPMVVSAVCARTPDAPLAEIVAACRAIEAEGTVLEMAVFPVQPWLDVPNLGFGVLACADGDVAAAQAAAERIADMAWAARERFVPGLVPLEDAIAIGLSSPGMTLVGDGGDSPTSGAGADRPDVLRALLAAGADRHDRPILLALCDPEAASAAHAAGEGAILSLHLGHAFTPGDKLAVTAVVERLSDGRFVMRDAGAKGLAMEHGPTAVLAIGAIRLVARTMPGMEWDTALYRSVGLDPAAAGMVFVKSPGHFRVSFEPLAARTILADTPGPACGNTAAIAWTRVTRPIWPLDR